MVLESINLHPLRIITLGISHRPHMWTVSHGRLLREPVLLLRKLPHGAPGPPDSQPGELRFMPHHQQFLVSHPQPHYLPPHGLAYLLGLYELSLRRDLREPRHFLFELSHAPLYTRRAKHCVHVVPLDDSLRAHALYPSEGGTPHPSWGSSPPLHKLPPDDVCSSNVRELSLEDSRRLVQRPRESHR